MGSLTPGEQATVEMTPVWHELLPVAAFHEAAHKFLREELVIEADHQRFGIMRASRLMQEFQNEIWPHRIPAISELVVARAAGRLEEGIAELNKEFEDNR